MVLGWAEPLATRPPGGVSLNRLDRDAGAADGRWRRQGPHPQCRRFGIGVRWDSGGHCGFRLGRARRDARLGFLRRNRDRDRARHRRLTLVGVRGQGEAMVARRERRRDDDKLARSVGGRLGHSLACVAQFDFLVRRRAAGDDRFARGIDVHDVEGGLERRGLGRGLVGRSRSAWRRRCRDSRRGRRDDRRLRLDGSASDREDRRDSARENPDGSTPPRPLRRPRPPKRLLRPKSACSATACLLTLASTYSAERSIATNLYRRAVISRR